MTKDVPADTIVAGNPARIIRKVGEEKKARQVLQRIEARIKIGSELEEDKSGPVTVSRYADRWVPRPRILHPSPLDRFYAKHPR